MNVLIDFFDAENSNNCIFPGNIEIDRLLFLYFSFQYSDETKIKFDHLERYYRTKTGLAPVFICIDIFDIDRIVGTISPYFRKNNRYFIDITGGNETLVFLTGLLKARLKRYDITVIKYVYQVNDYVLVYPKINEKPVPCEMSVDEIISIHNGTILEKADNRFAKCNFTEASTLWMSVKSIRREWNTFCSIPQIYPVKGRRDIIAKRAGPDERKTVEKVISSLSSSGVVSGIKDVSFSCGEFIQFELEILKESNFLFRKSGTIFELYCFMAFKESGRFASLYSDTKIEYDGKTNSDNETSNEIDLVAKEGNLPYFISCKNTNVTNEFLYEINSVSKQYGGNYSRAVMLSSERFSETIVNRAIDMNISFIDNISSLDYEELIERIRKI